MTTRNAHRKIIGVAALAGFLASVPAASAYNVRTCNGQKVKWASGPTVEYEVQSASFPPGLPERDALERVRAAWNTFAPGSGFEILFTDSNESGWMSGDGLNTVTFSDLSGVALAATVLRYSPCAPPYTPGLDGSIIEADILFNSNYVWNVATQPAPDSEGYSLALVGVREFGQSLGLLPENRWLAMMNTYYPLGGVLGNANDPDPHADDVAGARALYPQVPAIPLFDLAASAYKRDISNFYLVTTPIPAPGSALRCLGKSLVFTVSNRGNVPMSNVPVAFYLSTNRTISTGDFFLGRVTIPILPAGSESTYSASVTIPCSAPSGSRYIGYLLDAERDFSETDEDNNGVGYVSPTTILP
jgi:hypothetical protein